MYVHVAENVELLVFFTFFPNHLSLSIFTIVLMTVHNYHNMLRLSSGKTLKVVSPELLMS